MFNSIQKQKQKQNKTNFVGRLTYSIWLGRKYMFIHAKNEK